MGKESITLSMELAKTQCYEFECFEDNYSLTISMQGCRINMCFPGRDTYFPGGGTHITRDMCFPGQGRHITRDMCFPGGGTNTLTWETHIPSDGEHISLEIRVFQNIYH